MNKFLFYCFLLMSACCVILLLTSCEPEDYQDNPNRKKDTVKEWIYTTLDKDYLWNSDLPKN